MPTFKIYESEEFAEENFIDDSLIVLWSSYETRRNFISIPFLVESNSNKFRDEYLYWLKKIENFSFKGKRVDSSTTIYPGLNLWELSTLKEKSLWKTPEIYSAVRLLAFVSYFESIPHEKFNKAIIQIHDPRVSKILTKYLEKYFERVEEKRISKKLTLRELYDCLPEITKSFIFLLQYKWKTLLFSTPETKGKSLDGVYSFFSYFLLYKLDESKNFESNYWTDMHKILPDRQNWFHLYTKSKALPNIEKSRMIVNSINDPNYHTIFEDFQTRSVLLRAIRNYLKFFFTYRFPSFSFINRQINLEPDFSSLFEKHWKDSIYGKTCLQNFILMESIKNLVNYLPKQKVGFYLLENQSWEKILNFFWHQRDHGPLFGVQHNAVCFWDLRHTGPLKEFDVNNSIYPTKILLNGQSAYDSYLNSGWNRDNLEKVEALRYSYIKHPSGDRPVQNKNNKILFLGDYSEEVNFNLAEFCKKVIKHLGDDFDITFKSHPASDTDFTSLIHPNIKITEESLDLLATQFELIITSNPTTSAVELLAMGARVFIHIDGKFFNLSPLKGYNVDFISQKNIDDLFSASQNQFLFDNFFYIDNKLEKWRSLLHPIIHDK